MPFFLIFLPRTETPCLEWTQPAVLILKAVCIMKVLKGGFSDLPSGPHFADLIKISWTLTPAQSYE